ncbi:MAG TPA: NfeD family protein [Verrucomicrobiae bacterium]|nr:NfeD family protein [Verrucomicrobiae bacterium]
MNWMTIVILIVSGLVLIAIDFYLPGFVLGSVGIVLMLVSLALAHRWYGLDAMLLLFPVELVLGFGVGYASIKLFPKTAMGRRMILGETQTGLRTQTSKRQEEWIGRAGVAQTVLRPAGMALIDGKRLDVEAESGVIESGSLIKVVAVHENRLVVRKTG